MTDFSNNRCFWSRQCFPFFPRLRAARKELGEQSRVGEALRLLVPPAPLWGQRFSLALSPDPLRQTSWGRLCSCRVPPAQGRVPTSWPSFSPPTAPPVPPCYCGVTSGPASGPSSGEKQKDQSTMQTCQIHRDGDWWLQRA